MKIIIEAHERTYTAELEDDIGALNQAVRGLLVAVGYHINTVGEYFPHWEDIRFIDSDDIGYHITFPEADGYNEKQKYEESGESFGI